MDALDCSSQDAAVFKFSASFTLKVTSVGAVLSLAAVQKVGNFQLLRRQRVPAWWCQRPAQGAASVN